MTGYDALALGVLTVVPLLLAFVAWRRQWFRWVLLAGGVPRVVLLGRGRTGRSLIRPRANRSAPHPRVLRTHWLDDLVRLRVRRRALRRLTRVGRARPKRDRKRVQWTIGCGSVRESLPTRLTASHRPRQALEWASVPQ